MRLPGFASLLVALVAAAAVHAAPQTICTITVNSADEKEAFHRHLPKARFVELVEKGRADWLASACEKAIACDVLVISGHFNAGDVFYSDRPGSDDALRVDELERASCSDSCPALFSQLKEVYLFGCESLNPDASRYASAHGDSGRERMQRIFAKVPVIYGFSMAAPVGTTAATLLDRHFASGQAAVGSGRRNASLLSMFSQSGMTATRGTSEALAYRQEVCRFFDERLDAAQKLAFIHAMMRSDMGRTSLFLERIEALFASLPEVERLTPSFLLALAEISADDATRERYLQAARNAAHPAFRIRMIDLAVTLGWLTPQQRTAELLAMVEGLFASRTLAPSDVASVCALGLDEASALANAAGARPESASQAALRACLGDSAARERVLAALASRDDRDVQVAQVYLRHRPALAGHELRELARAIVRMPSGAAQVRALDTLGRLRPADREIGDELMRSFAAARSVEVQRAIAEVFLRADPRALGRPDLAAVLRRHRIASRGDDLIDVLIRRLDAEPPAS